MADAATIRSEDVLDHLNATVVWYQHVTSVDESTSAPQNLLLQDNVRQSAKQVVRTAFAFARAEAASLKGASPGTAPISTPDQARTLEQIAATANERVQNLQSRIDDLNKQIDGAGGKNRLTLISLRDTLTADLSLAKQAQASLQAMVNFASGSSSPGAGLLGQINFLASSGTVPAALNESSTQQTASPRNNQPTAFRPQSSGLMTLIADTVTLVHARTQIHSLISETRKLERTITKVSDPLRANVKELVKVGDDLAKAAGQETDPAKLNDIRKQIIALGAKFKFQTSSILPLSEQGLAVQATLGNLEQWNQALTDQLQSVVGYLSFRLGILVAIILGVLALSAISERATLRYVRDSRRRRQFVVIRRIIVGSAIGLLVVFTFFSGFGSFATVAGFVTAGLAVALQNVILSVVAYFFLIGRYGLRSGDRVTVAGINGQVIEVGLVRIYVMELAGTGLDLHSTGRVAVFSNSVIFQPSALIKQAPGTEYTWHTVTAAFTPATSLEDARKRVGEAVVRVFDSYRQQIESQHQAFEQAANMQIPDPTPVSRAVYGETETQIIVRFPVVLSQMQPVDEQVIESVMAEIAREPKLELASGGFPKIASA